MNELTYIITAGLSDRPVSMKESFDAALDFCAARYYPDEILGLIVEIHTLKGDEEIEIFNSMDLYHELRCSGRYD